MRRNFLHRSAQWGTILIGLSVPISTAFDNLMLAWILVATLPLLPMIYRDTQGEMVVRAAVALFGVLALAMSYGPTPLPAAFSTLAKYIDLLFVPVFIYLLRDEALRRKARDAFLLAMAITMALSYLVAWQILPVQTWMTAGSGPDNAIVFHSHITQNNMMAYAVFLALLQWRNAAVPHIRSLWSLYALLGAIDILFLVQGRTGYLVLQVLLGWFAWTSLTRWQQRCGRPWGWRQGAAVLMGMIVLGVSAYFASAHLRDRLNSVAIEYRQWEPDHGQGTSTGERLDFYTNSLQIVRDHPLLGVGTGGFAQAYAVRTQGKDVKATSHPHNEFLMVATQTGIIGLGVLLFLFYALWRQAAALGEPMLQDAARGLVLAYVVNSLFNSPLHDHADGLLFAFMTAVLFAGRKERTYG